MPANLLALEKGSLCEINIKCLELILFGFMAGFFRRKKNGPKVRENLGFGTPKLYATLPDGTQVAIRGAFKPYLARAFAKTQLNAWKNLLDESRRQRKGVINTIRERNSVVQQRKNFTKRPRKAFGLRALTRYVRGRGNVASDPGYAELHAEADFARNQLSSIVNFHLKRNPNKRIAVNPKNFFVSSGNTGTLQIVSSAIAAWRPFKKTRGKPVLFEGDPSYWGFGPQLAAGASFRNLRIIKRKDFATDFIEQMKEIKPDLAYLMTPHNPTGRPVTDEQIIAVARNLPKETVLLVDMTISSDRRDKRTPLKKLAEIMDKIGPEKKVVFFVSASKEYQMVRERVGIACTVNPALEAFLNNPSASLPEKHRGRFKNALLFDDKTVSPDIEKVVKRMTATELGISTASRRIIGGTTYHLGKAALSEGYRVLGLRARQLSLETIPDATGTFTVIGLPQIIPAKELLGWFEKNKYWKKEDQAMALEDIGKNQLRIFMGRPKTLDRWLNFVQLFLIQKGVIAPRK